MLDTQEKIRKTLRDIMEYIGAPSEFANDATLQTYLERLLPEENK